MDLGQPKRLSSAMVVFVIGLSFSQNNRLGLEVRIEVHQQEDFVFYEDRIRAGRVKDARKLTSLLDCYSN